MIHNSKDKFPKINPPAPIIDRLYPDFTAEERAEAQEFWKRYIALVWRIYRRIRREEKDKI